MSDLTEQPDPSPESTGPGEEELQPFVITMPDDPASRGDWYLWAAVLALIALVAFWPAINGTFLWDDDQYVTQNRALLDSSGLKEIWKIPPGTIQYYPLTFTVFWVEHQIWGNNSLGYRVVNLLLHAGAAIVLWRILRRLKIPGAWAAAAIWAVHPLQAESVCWISECKNVLSGVLALGSVLFYLEFAGLYDPASQRRTWNLNEDWQTYAISAGLFLLAMLAKTSVVFLPIAILLILWWKGRLTFARALGTAPMLIIGAALAWETSRLETDPNGAVRAFGADWQFSAAQRLLISGRDFWFYIGKLLLPIHQSFVYPRLVPNSQDAVQWILLLAAIAVLIALFAGIARLGRGPLAAALCYLLLIFPALGFFNVYPFRFSFVADHFQYLAGIPLIVLVVCIVARIFGPLWKVRAPLPEQPPVKTSPAIAVLVSILLVVLGATAWIRADVFSEPAKLWADVLQPDKNPDSWLAAYNLAKIRQGDAKAGFEEADRLLQGGDKDSATQEGQAALGALDDSDRLLKAALDNPATPDDVRYKAYDLWAQNDVTRLLSPDSNASVVLSHAREELKLAMASPAAAGDPVPYYTMGLVDRDLAETIRKESAPSTRATQASATTRPNSPQEQRFADLYAAARENFQKSGQLAEASLNSPVMGPEATQVLPRAALQSGDIDWQLAALAHDHADRNTEDRYSRYAVVDYGDAARLNPTNAEIRFQLALAMENVNDLDGAKEQLMVILRDLDHYNAAAYNEIGRVILESRPTDMAEFEAAVESFKTAIKLNPNLAGAQRNLALAMRMLATSRPATRSATGPSTKP
jgi:tetratricopeptide (TPR) repeat protein